MARPWLILREGDRRRWGGDLRRRYLLDALAFRTRAVIVDDWRPSSIEQTLRGLRGPGWQTWRRPASVASTELLADVQLAPVLAHGEPLLVDVHDEPLIQNDALGLPTPADEARVIGQRIRANLDAFRFHVAQSHGFARLAGMDAARTIIAPNGTDPSHIHVRPMPAEPVIGYVSGAAPGRGIETLVEAAAIARREIPDLILRLWLVPTGPASQVYLDGLRAWVADRPWVDIGSVAYGDLTSAFATTRVLAVPNPPNAYWDTVLPIKLFDSMAAGRPMVVTPRTEMAAIVRESEAGLVAQADGPDALADAIVRLLRDRLLAERLGSAARRAVEERYAWAVIGERLAEDLQARMT